MEFTTAGGVAYKIKSVLTGRDLVKIQAAARVVAPQSTSAADLASGSVNTGVDQVAIAEAALLCGLIELNGRADDLLNRVLDLPAADYLEILKRVMDVFTQPLS